MDAAEEAAGPSPERSPGEDFRDVAAGDVSRIDVESSFVDEDDGNNSVGIYALQYMRLLTLSYRLR